MENILIVGKVWPEPNSSAAGMRMMQLIEFFIGRGNDVTFVSTAKHSEFQEDLSAYDLTYDFVSLNDSSFNKLVEEKNPKAVIFDRFMTEEQFGWRVMESCPKALRILNTEDLHFLRDARHRAVKKGVEIDLINYRSEMQLREIAAIYRSDISLMISDYEVELLHSIYGLPKEKLLHVPLFDEKIIDQVGFDDRADFMFIGNYRHEPNWDAVRYLKSTIWPLIRKKLPKASLKIYGAYCSEKVYQLTNERERFMVIGRAEDAKEVTKKARVSLAPIRFGAGIKGKLIEAMCCGTPSVTTSVGAEGMILEGLWGGFVTDEPESFAERAIELYREESTWIKAQKQGFELLEKRFSKERAFSDFKDFLDENCDLNDLRKKSLVGSILQHQSFQASRYMSIWIEEKKRNGRGGS
ncbi:MAG: glycosyltransferase family 4 protein [Crocinitomicaceae bacterium]|nr:glycosyltransferase family 4 protein [Crocinitomicaceae bacterium]